VLALAAAPVFGPMARDVRIDPALAWFFAALNLAVIVVAIVMLVTQRRSRSGGSARSAAGASSAGPPPPTASRPTPNQASDEWTPLSLGKGGSVTVVRPQSPAPFPSPERRDGEILSKLSNPDPMMRVRAVASLRGRADQERVLLRALHDEYPVVRREVVRTLRTVRGTLAAEALI